jgi:transcriptional regulator with XRE-family HTH domain
MGQAIRSRRLEQGLTMAQLAERADLSQPFLSKVERGLGRLSMSAIDRVAKALGTSAVGLFAGSEPPAPIDVVRRDERLQVDAYDHGEGIGQALTRRSGQLRVMEFVGGPEDFADTPYVHRNDSVCVVLSGTYEFEFDDTVVVLHDGDSVSAGGGVGLRYRVVEKPARMLLILVSEDVDVAQRPATEWVGSTGR